MSSVRVALQHSPVQVLRTLCQEIRKNTSQIANKDNELVRYLLQETRKYQTTDERLCKARHELQFVAESYLTYLQSGRQYREISKYYTGKGERSVSETANLVGFKLPHDPK